MLASYFQGKWGKNLTTFTTPTPIPAPLISQNHSVFLDFPQEGYFSYLTTSYAPTYSHRFQFPNPSPFLWSAFCYCEGFGGLNWVEGTRRPGEEWGRSLIQHNRKGINRNQNHIARCEVDTKAYVLRLHNPESQTPALPFFSWVTIDKFLLLRASASLSVIMVNNIYILMWL